jgi:methionyl-tRNA formyltransferase
MKVGVITNAIARGVRIASEIEKNPGVEAWVLVFDPRGCSFPVRLVREIYYLASRRVLFKSFRRLLRGRILYFRKSISHPSSLERIRNQEFAVGVHDLNVIYRRPIIDAFGRGILNSHIGILPRYRGRCVAEWSMLEGSPTGITVFFIDEGIDTGRHIVLKEEVPVPRHTSIGGLKSFLFDRDAEMYRKALTAILGGKELLINETDQGQRYYPMSQLLLNVVEKLAQS